jgi:hypothetical protein
MFISIDDKTYSRCYGKCLDTKFKKGTMHYKDSNDKDKKIKIIMSNGKLYMYHPQKILGKEIIPRSLLLLKICQLISDIAII